MIPRRKICCVCVVLARITSHRLIQWRIQGGGGGGFQGLEPPLGKDYEYN